MDSSFTFRIPADILEQLRVMAEEQDVSIAQLFRKMAREYVANNKTNKGCESQTCARSVV